MGEVNLGASRVSAVPGTPEVAKEESRTSSRRDTTFFFSEIIDKLEQIGLRERDVLRKNYQSSLPIYYEKQVIAFNTRLAAINKNCEADKLRGAGKMASGFGTMVGGATGNQAAAAVGRGTGETVSGAVDIVAAGMTRDAEQGKLLGDFQSSTADQLFKELESLARDAANASRETYDRGRAWLDRYIPYISVGSR
jgi:hypothetical protein